jgi:predicted phage terminase large subunit-like protein
VTVTSPWEYAARAFEDHDPWPTPGAMAQALDRTTVQTPALDLIDAELVKLAAGADDRLILSMPPQEGKSQRVSRRFPLWCLRRNPELRIAVASYELGAARRWGRDVRNDIITHGPELGLAVSGDTAAAQEWQLAGHRGGMYCVGIGGALTGRPVDLMIIDDPVKGPKEADSAVYRDAAWDWWESVGSTRLAPGAPVVLVLTRWHQDDLAGRLMEREPGVWRTINVPALADHRPEHGEADPLGRQPGEYLVSTRGRTREQWDTIRTRRGSRVWNALYQGRPAPAEGGVLQRSWWQRYDQPQWIERDDGSRIALSMDELLISWDMAFKDLDSSDYVVGQVWARRGTHAYLLDQVRRRMSFVETCQAVRTLAARWPQAVLKLVEDKANGTAVINALSRTVAGLVPVEPDGSKVARASAVSPFAEAGNVWLPAPELAPWVDDLVEECAGFPNGQHDDQVDALSQGLNRLLLAPLLAGGEVYEDDEVDTYAISAY